jgi:hypothetical protein
MHLLEVLRGTPRQLFAGWTSVLSLSLSLSLSFYSYWSIEVGVPIVPQSFSKFGKKMSQLGNEAIYNTCHLLSISR